jgi:hypothetical protein
MTNGLSPREIQIAQIMAGLAAAIFIGGFFLPPRHRQRVGLTLTVCYLIGIAVFIICVVFS